MSPKKSVGGERKKEAVMDLDTVDIYLDGNCHLLSYFLSRRIENSTIYVMEETVAQERGGSSSTAIVHSMVKFGERYWDILGPTSDIPDYIASWKRRNGLGSSHSFALRPARGINELRLKDYHIADVRAAEDLIPTYANLFGLELSSSQ